MVTGSGTSGDPYILYNLDDLELIGTGGYGLDKVYKLNNDIDASATADPEYNSGAGWLPIDGIFTGTFDGNSKKITGLYINRPTTDYVGFFEQTQTTNIKNLTFEDADITGQDYTGILVGYGLSSISNSSIVLSGVVTGRDYVGSLVGHMQYITCRYITSSASVTGRDFVGGIVGEHFAYGIGTYTFQDLEFTGEVTGRDYVGGIAGYGQRLICQNDVIDTVINGNNYVGGFAGYFLQTTINDTVDLTCTINATGDYVGGVVGHGYNGCVYSDLSITNVIINVSSTSDQVGGIAGRGDHYSLSYQTFSNCFVVITISGCNRIGGLIGSVGSCRIDDCYTVVTLEGKDYVGGLVGYFGGSFNSWIKNSHATVHIESVGIYVGGAVGYLSNTTSGFLYVFSEGYVESNNMYVGGLIGMLNGTSSLTDCYSHCTCIGYDYVGGLIGYNNNEALERCYSKGAVTGVFNTGGLVGGKAGTPTSTDCFWDTETSGQASSTMGTGKTTSEMQTQETYTNYDFSTIWSIDASYNGGYPYLQDPGITYDLYLLANGADVSPVFGDAWIGLPDIFLASCYDEDCFLPYTSSYLFANGIASSVVFGSASLSWDQVLESVGIAPSIAFGHASFAVVQTLIANGIPPSVAFSSTLKLCQTIKANGLNPTIVFGNAMFSLPQLLEAIGISPTVQFGEAELRVLDFIFEHCFVKIVSEEELRTF